MTNGQCKKSWLQGCRSLGGDSCARTRKYSALFSYFEKNQKTFSAPKEGQVYHLAVFGSLFGVCSGTDLADQPVEMITTLYARQESIKQPGWSVCAQTRADLARQGHLLGQTQRNGGFAALFGV
jgi:hypothetical protein